MDCSPPSSSIHGILQARILEWVAIPFSRGSSWLRIEPGSPALLADSLPSEPQEHDKGLKKHSVQRELSMRVADITWVVREGNSLRKWRSSLCSREVDFPCGSNSKEPAYEWRRHKRCWFNPRVGKIPCSRAWQPTPLFLAGESCGQRSLAGYSP